MQLLKRLNGIEFNISVEGFGEPMLFVHGFPLDHSMWTAQIAEFSKSYQVIAPDLRGFGQTVSDDKSVSMGEFADDLALILDELGIQTAVHFCGLSMGGYIAWQFSLRHSEKLKSLILCDTKAADDSEEGKQTRLATAAKVVAEGTGFLAEAMPEKLFSEATISKNRTIIEQTQAVIRSTSPQSIAAALRGMAARPDMREILPSINVPSLIIVGEHDSITTSEEMKQIAETIPNATFSEIKNAGHMSPLEQPVQVNAAISQFLQQFES